MFRNAYFQIKTKDDGVYLVLYPPSGGADALTLSDMRQYFELIQLSEYDRSALVQALANQHETNEIKLCEEPIPPVGEAVIVSVSDDKMTAVARFYAASDDGPKLSRNEIVANLTAAGVTYGIFDARIDYWLENRIYCTNFLIAEGFAPEESIDAILEYKFDINLEIRPTITEDGNVDFHQLTLLNSVVKGDELAVLTPAYHGKPGMNVNGVSLPSRKPVLKTLKYGKNVALSEDGLTLISQVGGHAELDREKVIVHNVYTVKGNVATATGDIDYDGIVSISGDVLTGYSVKATANIYVYGVVEGAVLTADGDIVLANGVHGNAKAIISAGKNVTANFIQESVITAGGSVNSGSILYSNVTALNSIIVTSGKGLVKGGELRAGSLIAIKTVGSARTGANVQLTVGADPDEEEIFHKLESSLAARFAERTKMLQSLSFITKKMEKGESLQADHKKLMEVLPGRLAGLENEIEQLSESYAMRKSSIEKSDAGKIVIEGSIYEGAKIEISSVSYVVKNEISSCQFKKKNLEIVINSLH